MPTEVMLRRDDFLQLLRVQGDGGTGFMLTLLSDASIGCRRWPADDGRRSA